jgi:hypothetical protein
MIATIAKTEKNISRLGYSPAEFAALFGRHASWAYRAIYRGELKVIQGAGRLIIPASEAERLLNSAESYDPEPKAKKKGAAQ